MTNETVTIKQVWFGILLVVLMTGGYILANVIIDNAVPPAGNIDSPIDRIARDVSPYQHKESLTKTVLVSGFENSSIENKPTNSFNREVRVTGNIKGGYLYVRASVGGSALKVDDGVYIKLSGLINGKYQEFGGHLIRSRSLEAPLASSSTEFLYKLDDIKYKQSYVSSDVEVISGDWLKLFNGGADGVMIGFSSTEGKGLIEEIAIYSECVSEGCSISVTS